MLYSVKRTKKKQAIEQWTVGGFPVSLKLPARRPHISAEAPYLHENGLFCLLGGSARRSGGHVSEADAKFSLTHSKISSAASKKTVPTNSGVIATHSEADTLTLNKLLVSRRSNQTWV